jgi:tetratricopeptide (TPR) repeat protein
MEEDKVLDAMDHLTILGDPAMLLFEISPIKFPPPLTGEGKGGGGQNRELFIPPPLRPLPPRGGEILRNHFRESKRIFLPIFCVVFIFLFLPGCSLPKVTIPKDPLAPEEHLNLGLAYEKKGLLDSAIQEYKRAAKKLPIAYLYLGNAYFLKNELSKAETFYKKMIKKDPRNGDAHNNLAWLYYTKRENLDAAEEYALIAIEFNPLKGDIYRDTLEKIRELKKLQ